MDIIGGLPAHALLLHFVVVLAPLTAILEIVCGLWPAARRGQLLWLTLILAAATMVLTPMTTNAGQWLYDLRVNPSPILREHADRGSQMIYFSAALLAVADRIGRPAPDRTPIRKAPMATNVIVGDSRARRWHLVDDPDLPDRRCRRPVGLGRRNRAAAKGPRELAIDARVQHFRGSAVAAAGLRSQSIRLTPRSMRRAPTRCCRIRADSTGTLLILAAGRARPLHGR